MNDLLLVNLISLLKKSRFVEFKLNDFEDVNTEFQNLHDNFEDFGLTDIKCKDEYGNITVTVGIMPDNIERYNYKPVEDYL